MEQPGYCSFVVTITITIVYVTIIHHHYHDIVRIYYLTYSVRVHHAADSGVIVQPNLLMSNALDIDYVRILTEIVNL